MEEKSIAWPIWYGIVVVGTGFFLEKMRNYKDALMVKKKESTFLMGNAGRKKRLFHNSLREVVNAIPKGVLWRSSPTLLTN